jgi:hypothetical protein
LLQAGGLPLLRALQVLLRSQHNRAVLCSLGLLPALCELVRQLAQKLQAVSGVLAVRSSRGSLDAAVASQARPSRSGSQLRLLQPLLVLLQEVLALVQAFAEHETAQRREAAVLGSKGSSNAASHAVQASAQEAATAAAAASAAAQTEAAVAPLVERGLLARCCELLPVLLRVRLHSSSDGNGRKSVEQEQALEAVVTALERRVLGCLLALQVASRAGAAAALVQQQGGQLLAMLVRLLGWPLASAEQQLQLASAASSSSSLAAEQAAPDEQQQQRHASSSSRSSSFVWVSSGSGLRPAGEELRLQLLALRALGAAVRSGGGVCLRLLQQQGCFARLTQLLQWAALTFDSVPAGGPGAEAAEGGAAPEKAPQGSAELEQLFLALWGWVSGGSGSGAAKALLPLLLDSVLGAFSPAAAAEAPAGLGGQRQKRQQQQQEEQRQQLSSSDLLFHEAAVAALCGGGGSASGSRCGCGLQQQALLLGARLLGREQRLLPLLLPAGAGLQEQVLASSGGLASTDALANLQILRAAGEEAGSMFIMPLAAALLAAFLAVALLATALVARLGGC